MIDPARFLALIEQRRVEWALEGARFPNRDASPEFTYGTVVGRDEALSELRGDIERMIAEEEDREEER